MGAIVCRLIEGADPIIEIQFADSARRMRKLPHFLQFEIAALGKGGGIIQFEIAGKGGGIIQFLNRRDRQGRWYNSV